MKMSGFVVILVLGLAICGLLVWRHATRAPASSAPVGPAPVIRRADDLRPVDAWQQGIKLAPAEKLDWREKLRREEEKQRPWEGRN